MIKCDRLAIQEMFPTNILFTLANLEGTYELRNLHVT